MALSMEEQRMLDEMERNLAADDPRLAARLGAFGRQRMPGPFHSQQARTIGGILALALIAAITIMVFVISPFTNHARNDTNNHGKRQAPAASTTSKTTDQRIG